MNNCDVLIVEDEAVREIIYDFLEMKGYKVKATDKGETAIKLIKEELPKIVLLDILLADDVDGIEVLRQIKPEIDGMVKIFIMSAYKDKYEDYVKELGAYDFLNKPIVLKTLLNLVENALKNGATKD